VGRLTHAGWLVELFGQAIPVRDQRSFRLPGDPYLALLALEPLDDHTLREAVPRLKK